MGKTVTASIFNAWYLTFNYDKTTLLLANKSDSTKEIIDKRKLGEQPVTASSSEDRRGMPDAETQAGTPKKRRRGKQASHGGREREEARAR